MDFISFSDLMSSYVFISYYNVSLFMVWLHQLFVNCTLNLLHSHSVCISFISQKTWYQL